MWLAIAIIIIFVLHNTIWIPIALSAGLTVCVVGGPIAWAVLPAAAKARIAAVLTCGRQKPPPELMVPIKEIEGGPLV